MNNNQNNFNQNHQMSNMNNPQNNFLQNNNQPLNVIPQMQNNQNNNNFNQVNQNPIQGFNLPNNNMQSNFNQTQTNDFNNVSTQNFQQQMPQQNQNNNLNNVFSNESSSIRDNISDEDYAMLNPQPDNKFINSNYSANNTALTDLNVHTDGPRIDYANDPKVRANLENAENTKKTITITGEMKVFLLIIAVMVLFMFVMPYIFDLLREIKH